MARVTNFTNVIETPDPIKEKIIREKVKTLLTELNALIEDDPLNFSVNFNSKDYDDDPQNL